MFKYSLAIDRTQQGRTGPFPPVSICGSPRTRSLLTFTQMDCYGEQFKAEDRLGSLVSRIPGGQKRILEEINTGCVFL